MFNRSSGVRNDGGIITLLVDKHPLGLPFYRPGDCITGVVRLKNVPPPTAKSLMLLCLEGFQDVRFLYQGSGSNDVPEGPREEKGSVQFLNICTMLHPREETKLTPSGAYDFPFEVVVPLEFSKSDVKLQLASDSGKVPKSVPEERHAIPPSAFDGGTSHVRYRLMATGSVDSSTAFLQHGALTAVVSIQIIPEFPSQCTREVLQEQVSSERKALTLQVIEPRSSHGESQKLFGRMLSAIQPSQRYDLYLDVVVTCQSKIQLNNPQPFKLILKLWRSKTEPGQPYFHLALKKLQVELCKTTRQHSRERFKRKEYRFDLLEHLSAPFEHQLEFNIQPNGLDYGEVDLGALLDLQVPRKHESGSHWPSIFTDGQPNCTPTFESIGIYSQSYTLDCNFDVIQVDRPKRVLHKRRGPISPEVEIIGPPPTMANDG